MIGDVAQLKIIRNVSLFYIVFNFHLFIKIKQINNNINMNIKLLSYGYHEYSEQIQLDLHF